VTIVSMLRSVHEDLYMILGTVNPETKVATLQVHVNPLVSWIWLGCCVLICGSIVCMWPQLVLEESRFWAYGRSFAGIATSVSVGLLLALLPAPAYAQAGMDNMHSHTIRIENDHERAIFGAVRCMCGGCTIDTLATCACETAEAAREEIRREIAAGKTKDEIILSYREAYGITAMAIPPNEGALRAIYAVPLVAIFGGAVGLGFTIRRWRARGRTVQGEAQPAKDAPAPKRDDYDARLDDELKDLDG
jgi:cytochrome c-type biogenesis protein CcmF